MNNFCNLVNEILDDSMQRIIVRFAIRHAIRTVVKRHQRRRHAGHDRNVPVHRDVVDVSETAPQPERDRPVC